MCISFGTISHHYVDLCFHMDTSWDLRIVLLHENNLLVPGSQVTIFTCSLISQKYTKHTNTITNSLLLVPWTKLKDTTKSKWEIKLIKQLINSLTESLCSKFLPCLDSPGRTLVCLYAVSCWKKRKSICERNCILYLLFYKSNISIICIMTEYEFFLHTY